MKILKFLLYAVLVLLVIYLILCAMGPKKMMTSQTKVINASPETVYSVISDYNQFASWSPWQKHDPEIAQTVTGEPGTVGHKLAWISKKMGNGSQTITALTPNQHMGSALTFDDMGTSQVDFNLKPSGEGTEVSWVMDGSDVPFMFRGLMKVMGMEKALEKDFQDGLTNLAKVAESKPKAPALAYEVVDMPAQWYVGKMFPATNVENIDSKMYETSYAEIGKAIGGMDKMAGMPMSIAHNYNESAHTMDLEIAMPVAAEMKVPAGLTCSMLPASKCAKYVYRGPYADLGNQWGMFEGEIAKKYKPAGDGYEVYANDPMNVKPEDVETWLIQPIQ